ncbi:MAG: CAP domain-containing protein [Candidatus Woesearchaeota archaeon]|jgi:uncharacterized protein YkwD|nr:CAP domain-containing protein [Candidatus Woesearchaeota archaeon]
MKRIKLKKRSLFQIFLIMILFYFAITYTFINKNTIAEQFEIIKESGVFFAKSATYKVLDLENDNIGYDKSTYEIELLVFDEINDIREDKGLNRLIWDAQLSRLAREHSFDMAQYDYFNHSDLFGDGPTQRAERLEIKITIETKDTIYTGIGENIGYTPRGFVDDLGVIITTKDISSGTIYEWMLSEPHKENILKEDYLYTGIGVAYDGKDGYLITQNFQ